MNGKIGEEFRIVRENDFLVVLQADSGCMFTGDFPHAGVRNFPHGSEEGALMKDLNNKIQEILDEGEETGEDHAETRREVVKMMCKFRNLDKICRLHYSTEPLLDWLRIPRNTVGFVDCHPNPPDNRYDDNGDSNVLSSASESEESEEEYSDEL